MSIQMIRSRLGKTLLGLVSMLAPTLSSSAQADDGATQVAPPATTMQPKGAGVVLVEDRVSELITTSGQATVVSIPDALRAELGVEIRVRTLTQARDELTLKIEKVAQAVKSLRRENLTLQTSQFSVSPIFDEAAQGKAPRIVAYRAKTTLTITLLEVDPAKLGAEAAAIVDTGVHAGANIVDGVAFFLSHPERARARALELAIQDAEHQAKIMASSAGLRVGPVHDVNGSPERTDPILFRQEMALRAMPNIEPGTISTTASVQVRYHFARP
ncbi:MAG TPA: SIMPL domain-containing protein [Polyangium sp.]|nr:SIMPL domain-containing protein [Polyangium sp.]